MFSLSLVCFPFTHLFNALLLILQLFYIRLVYISHSKPTTYVLDGVGLLAGPGISLSPSSPCSSQLWGPNSVVWATGSYYRGHKTVNHEIYHTPILLRVKPHFRFIFEAVDFNTELRKTLNGDTLTLGLMT
jgi:hypothetical protein